MICFFLNFIWEIVTFLISEFYTHDILRVNKLGKLTLWTQIWNSPLNLCHDKTSKHSASLCNIMKRNQNYGLHHSIYWTTLTIAISVVTLSSNTKDCLDARFGWISYLKCHASNNMFGQLNALWLLLDIIDAVIFIVWDTTVSHTENCMMKTEKRQENVF